jgi:hypothetical protein
MTDGMEEKSVSGITPFPEAAEAFSVDQVPEKLARDASAERVVSR